MDSAQNSLSRFVREFPQESNNCPCTLGVETGRWLVEEEEETGLYAVCVNSITCCRKIWAHLGHQFHRDCRSLAELDVESTHDGLRVLGQTTHVKTFLDANSECQYHVLHKI